MSVKKSSLVLLLSLLCYILRINGNYCPHCDPRGNRGPRGWNGRNGQSFSASVSASLDEIEGESCFEDCGEFEHKGSIERRDCGKNCVGIDFCHFIFEDECYCAKRGTCQGDLEDEFTLAMSESLQEFRVLSYIIWGIYFFLLVTGQLYAQCKPTPEPLKGLNVVRAGLLNFGWVCEVGVTLMFATQLQFVEDETKHWMIIIFILSIVEIILHIVITVVLSMVIKQNYNSYSQYTKNWISKYFIRFNIMGFVVGSSYAAQVLLNTNLYGLHYFDMKLDNFYRGLSWTFWLLVSKDISCIIFCFFATAILFKKEVPDEVIVKLEIVLGLCLIVTALSLLSNLLGYYINKKRMKRRKFLQKSFRLNIDDLSLSKTGSEIDSQTKSIDLSGTTPTPGNIFDSSADDDEEVSMLKEVINDHRSNSKADINVKLPIHYTDIEYDKKKLIGGGAFGKVYCVKWKTLGDNVKLCAYKVFSEHNINLRDSTKKKNIESEIIIALSIPTHDNLIKVYGYTMKPAIGILMTYMDNGSLYKYIYRNKDNNILTYKQKLIIYLSISKGLAKLHEYNLCHRDIAARNILLNNIINDNIDEKSEIRLSDYGSMRKIEGDKLVGINETIDNSTYSNFGPIKWMSPEAIQYRYYSKQTDIYMFGRTLWEIYYRSIPFGNRSNMQVALKVSQNLIQLCHPPNQKFHAKAMFDDNDLNIPNELKYLIDKCCQFKKENRPKSIQDVSDQLQSMFDQL